MENANLSFGEFPELEDLIRQMEAKNAGADIDNEIRRHKLVIRGEAEQIMAVLNEKIDLEDLSELIQNEEDEVKRLLMTLGIAYIVDNT